MIDPVGTGVSRAVGKAKDKEFWGTDPDIESVSRFIKEYVTANDRWSSPKYLLGESYGTTRSAGVVDYLQSNESMPRLPAVLEGDTNRLRRRAPCRTCGVGGRAAR